MIVRKNADYYLKNGAKEIETKQEMGYWFEFKLLQSSGSSS